MEIQPFLIRVPESTVVDLHERLDATRWSTALSDVGWDLGVDEGYLRSLVKYWRHTFQWRTVEARLNTFPQFLASVADRQIHFVHLRSSNSDAIPIVLTHGWPSTFAELLTLGQLLSDPRRHGFDSSTSFHVVIPSLPGFPCSTAPTAIGTDVYKIAELWVDLMKSLGYPRFVAHGGDIGAGVSTVLGLRHSTSTIAVHLNYIPGSYRPPGGEIAAPSMDEAAFIERRAAWADAEGAYAHIQSTKPNTLGPALNDSPVGLAAWILEKYRSWSDCNGNLETRFSKDELLTTVALYWFTATMPSAIRLYWETRRRPLRFAATDRVAIPVAIAHFPRELPTPPRSYVERGFNVVRWTEMDRGGHFAAVEEPHALAEDILSFASSLGLHGS